MRGGGLAPFSASLSPREQSHRRVTLVAIGALFVLSTSPVLGHHLEPGAENLLGGVDHVGTLCVTALRLLFQPVHYAFHLVLAAGVVYGLWDRARAWRSAGRALAPLEGRSPEPGGPFWAAARAGAVDPSRVWVVEGLPTPALTVGTLKPRIYLARELAEELTHDELAAVLAHEGAHLARRDPLRLFALRFLSCALFWIPALRRLADDVADEAEVLADERAARGRPLVLATALLTLAGRPHLRNVPDAPVGFYRGDLLELRVRRLTGEDVGVPTHVTRRSVLGALAALALAWASGILMAQPVPAAASAHVQAHCEHHGESAVHHLFCLGGPFAALARQCPHADGLRPLHAVV